MEAEFDRANPLFERTSLPFEIVSPAGGHACALSSSAAAASSTKYGNFTVRILQGHRSSKAGGERERVIRFELSDECNLIDGSSESSPAGWGTPGRLQPGSVQHHTPKPPIIHAPFMTADRGRAGPFIVQQHQGYDAIPANQSGTISNRPILLYEMECAESDFADLRRDQALLVDFSDFAHSLISLLQLCEMGEGDRVQNASLDANDYGQQPPYGGAGGWNPAGQQWSNNCTWRTPMAAHPQQGMQMASPHTKTMPVSTYACRLEVDSSNSSDEGAKWRSAPKATHARFSVVESNQFRELTHLALSLDVGSDKSVRLYLSSRLSQTMLQNKSFQSLHDEQQRRLEVAETDLIGLNRRLRELTQTTEAEKFQLRHQAEERLQTENCSRLAAVSEVTAAKDAEIRALSEQSQKEKAVLENKVRALEAANAKIHSEKTACEHQNERLSTKLGYQETTNKTLSNELDSLRSQLQHVSGEKSSIEKSLHQLQLQLSSLEFSNTSHETTITQTEAKRVSAEKVSADAKQTLSHQHSQLEDLRRKLEEAELETAKYKDLTSRYKVDRVEMKKRIKEKVEMIRETSDVLVVREKETAELKRRVGELETSLRQAQSAKDAASSELIEARREREDDKKKIENNQQVIAWLNKQADSNRSASSSGAVWQAGRTAATANEGQVSLASPTPYQRPYVTPVSNLGLGATPAAKPVTGVAAPQRLHPEPTPYSRVPRPPNAAGR